MKAGITRAPRRPAGWIAPGPSPLGARGRADLEPAEGEDLCLLSGDWRIFQRVRGHRWSLDDLVTAWSATRALGGREPARALDLGCGIGSVMMMIAWFFPHARCIGVEAQPMSAAMARRSLAWNGADDRCEVRLFDLRDPALFGEGEKFDLVTGTPPYFPRGEGVESEQPQKGPCRFEHRGGVEAYCAAGARRLGSGARLVLCAAAGEVDRVERGAREAALHVCTQLDVVPRDGKPPRVRIFTLAREEPATCAFERLVVRDRAGAWTPEFANVRRAMGLPASPPLSRASP
jgi:tRNA1(Val) A37 N6-methylase TrmN6